MDRYAIQITMVIFLGFMVLFAVNGGKKEIQVQKTEQVALELLQ